MLWELLLVRWCFSVPGHEFTLAALAVIVAPLYGAMGLVYRRLGQLSGVTEDVDENEGDIQQIKETLVGLEHRTEILMQDNETLHQNVTEENHCQADQCRFCEGDGSG